MKRHPSPRARRLALIAIALTATLAACAGVLGLRSKSDPTAFPHRAHVLKGIACTTCHKTLAASGDDGQLHLPDDATCMASGCHATPHDPRPCLGCHADPMSIAGAVEARAHLRFAHDRHLTQFSGNCMRCHVGVADGDTRLRPTMQTCFDCHDHEAHQDARTCNACHRDLVDEGTLPASHLTHDGDWLHEHGARAGTAAEVCASCHKQTFCADCHGVTAPVVPARLHVEDPFRASVHRAGFRARHAIEARAEPGMCATCHAPTVCETCHARENVAADGSGTHNPHPAGWVGLSRNVDMHGRAARSDPASCAACHGGAGEKLCVRCHQVGAIGGNPHPPGWSSRQPLGALPCRECHINGTVR